jgi:signal transduction histidine kinase
VRDEDGGFLSVIRMFQDISGRKEIERMKDAFLSVASHELRTPLTAIRGAVGLAVSGSLGEIPPQALRMLDIASNNTERLMRLINDILDLERMNAGRSVLHMQACDAELLARQAVQSVATMAQEADVQVTVGITDISFVADPDRVVQTLTSLVANAVKFSPKGSTVKVSARIVDGGVRFDVVDNGRGIPSDQLERVFDRFLQVDASDSRVHGGTGLGLAISRHIVDQHGGRIWAESELGKGSTFSFGIPADPSAIQRTAMR